MGFQENECLDVCSAGMGFRARPAVNQRLGQKGFVTVGEGPEEELQQSRRLSGTRPWLVPSQSNLAPIRLTAAGEWIKYDFCAGRRVDGILLVLWSA